MNLLDRLPTPQRRAIDIVREVALEKGCHPYLVGGPVRDILIGRPAIDIDLTLEEGSSTLARALARRIQGRVRSFPQFLTYKVTADEFPEIDIATARRERYRAPGALPLVTAGKLKDDLLRRDFTINAIAVDLLDGTVHDPSDGERDLERRAVRVLHERSFADDPTRIFRAIRLARRLGFALDEGTGQLMRSAIEEDALTTVSRERIWRELFLAIEEEDAPAILQEITRTGALRALFGRRDPEGLEERLRRVLDQLESVPGADRYVALTGTLLRGDASPIDFEGSGFSQKRAHAVVQIANELSVVLETLDAAESERDRFALYRRLAPETLVAIAAERPEEVARIRRFLEFESFRLPLRGTDLEVPGGPHIARAIEKTREAVFNGEIPADEARSYARKVAKELLESRS